MNGIRARGGGEEPDSDVIPVLDLLEGEEGGEGRGGKEKSKSKYSQVKPSRPF